MITDFFAESKELRVFVPDINQANRIEEYEFSYREPEAKLIGLVGQTIYDQLKDYYANPAPADPILEEGVRLMQGSLANLCGVSVFIMDSGERNENAKLFKYQEDFHLDIYLNASNSELSQLLTHLDANTVKYPTWEDTTLYKTRVKQIIKTAAEFGMYYYIDESAYYFSKLVFLMKEITDLQINPLIGDFDDLHVDDDALIIEKVKQALAYLTVAMSLRRFDFIEIPRTIRNNITTDKSKTVRSGEKEGNAVARVASEIEGRGLDYIAALDRMMEKKETGDLDAPESIQDEDDPFFLQTI